MNQEDRERYLDQWGHGCFLCNAYVEREDMSLCKSIMDVKKHEGVKDSFQYYMVCPICKEKKVIV